MHDDLILNGKITSAIYPGQICVKYPSDLGSNL